jgi:hypothetical protein
VGVCVCGLKVSLLSLIIITERRTKSNYLFCSYCTRISYQCVVNSLNFYVAKFPTCILVKVK